LRIFLGSTGFRVRNARRGLKVRSAVNRLTYVEILTSEIGASILQLEDTLNLPESNFFA
jgi:hypothetical protein